MSPEGHFTEDIRVRVPKEVREAFNRLLSKQPWKKEAELVRDALVEYLLKQGESLEQAHSLHEKPNSASLVQREAKRIDSYSKRRKIDPPK